MKPKVEYKNGHFQTNVRIDRLPLENAFKEFLSKSTRYKKSFIQSKYDYGFDGYSYLGMKNSTNQYAYDLLHSFVISDQQPTRAFPKEFRHFIREYWDDLINKIATIEKEIILKLPNEFQSQIQGFHNKNTGYCASLNYYPEINNQQHNTRLSAHYDASFISVFPFGVEEGLQIETANKQWISVDASDNAIAFTGYLCQLMTENQVKATNHRVIFPNTFSQHRYSVVFFSIPKRDTQIPIINRSGYAYFEDYLKLF